MLRCRSRSAGDANGDRPTSPCNSPRSHRRRRAKLDRPLRTGCVRSEDARPAKLAMLARYGGADAGVSMWPVRWPHSRWQPTTSTARRTSRAALARRGRPRSSNVPSPRRRTGHRRPSTTTAAILTRSRRRRAARSTRLAREGKRAAHRRGGARPAREARVAVSHHAGCPLRLHEVQLEAGS